MASALTVAPTCTYTTQLCIYTHWLYSYVFNVGQKGETGSPGPKGDNGMYKYTKIFIALFLIII